MNTFLKITTIAFIAAVLSNAASAQTQNEKPLKSKTEKTQEIVIRKKPGSAEKMTIVVDGDKVTINGKPVDDFKNDDVTISKRDFSLAPLPNVRSFQSGRGPFDPENFNYLTPRRSNKALLGIMSEKVDSGIKVTEVTKESSAEKAGIKKDDIITKVGGKTISTSAGLVEAIGAYKPNDKVDITYQRNGKENKTTATLGENKSAINSPDFDIDNFSYNGPDGKLQQLRDFNFNFTHKPRIGLQIQDVEEGKGVKVKDVDDDSPASKAGMKEGDIITQLNGKDVAGVDDLRDEVKDLKEGDVFKFNYKRDGKDQTAEVKIPKKLKSADL